MLWYVVAMYLSWCEIKLKHNTHWREINTVQYKAKSMGNKAIKLISLVDAL